MYGELDISTAQIYDFMSERTDQHDYAEVMERRRFI